MFAGWLLFRAADSNVLVAMLSSLAHWEWFSVHHDLVKAAAAVAIALGVIEYYQIHRQDPLAFVRLPHLPRALVSGTLLFLCVAMLRHHQ